MDKNWIEISLYGYIFYLPADRIRDLNFVDGKLVNISNSPITMVYQFSDRTTYPYITCSAMRACVIQVDNYYNQIVTERITYPNNITNMNMLGVLGYNQLIVGLLIVLIALKLLWKK